MPKKAVQQNADTHSHPDSSTKESIIGAAIMLFGKQGYDGTGVQEIVDMASVTKGAFYYNFESKSDLLRHIQGRFLDHMLMVINGISGEERSSTDSLSAIVRELLITVANNRAEVAIFVGDGRFLEGEIFTEVRSKRDEFAEKLVALLRRGAERKELRELGNPHAVASAIVGLCYWAYSWYKPEDGPIEGIADTYIDMVMHGLIVQPSGT